MAAGGAGVAAGGGGASSTLGGCGLAAGVGGLNEGGALGMAGIGGFGAAFGGSLGGAGTSLSISKESTASSSSSSSSSGGGPDSAAANPPGRLSEPICVASPLSSGGGATSLTGVGLGAGLLTAGAGCAALGAGVSCAFCSACFTSSTSAGGSHSAKPSRQTKMSRPGVLCSATMRCASAVSVRGPCMAPSTEICQSSVSGCLPGKKSAMPPIMVESPPSPSPGMPGIWSPIMAMVGSATGSATRVVRTPPSLMEIWQLQFLQRILRIFPRTRSSGIVYLVWHCSQANFISEGSYHGALGLGTQGLQVDERSNMPPVA